MVWPYLMNKVEKKKTEKCVALFMRKRKRKMMVMIDTCKWKTHIKTIMKESGGLEDISTETEDSKQQQQQQQQQ
jgi:ribosomal protein S8